MSANLEETIEDLRDVLVELRDRAHHTMYGVFCGDDPRQFTPDVEVCTPEEIARHKADCAAADAGLPITAVTACQPDADGILRETSSGYGMGITTLVDEDAGDWADRIERCISQLENLESHEPT